MCYGSGGGKLETVTRDCRRLNGLACSPGFGQQKMYMEGGSQARAGGDAINKCFGVHFGCAEDGVGVGTGTRESARQGALRPARELQW